jgi:hypothetical protein
MHFEELQKFEMPCSTTVKPTIIPRLIRHGFYNLTFLQVVLSEFLRCCGVYQHYSSPLGSREDHSLCRQVNWHIRNDCTCPLKGDESHSFDMVSLGKYFGISVKISVVIFPLFCVPRHPSIRTVCARKLDQETSWRIASLRRLAVMG